MWLSIVATPRLAISSGIRKAGLMPQVNFIGFIAKSLAGVKVTIFCSNHRILLGPVGGQQEKESNSIAALQTRQEPGCIPVQV